MRDISDLFVALKHSRFRNKFRLSKSEQIYYFTKGENLIRKHAEDVIRTRLAPQHPAADGKQTPWRGHPVFVAQHATATCCRSCLQKWHHIERGRELTEPEIQYVVKVLLTWMNRQEILHPGQQSEQLQMDI